jgi:hypothetical protein
MSQLPSRGSGAGPSRRKSGVRRAWARGPSVRERAAGQWPEPKDRWCAESEALGLVQLKGRGVPGEVGRARVTCRCVTGLGESQRGREENLPAEGGGVLVKK